MSISSASRSGAGLRARHQICLRLAVVLLVVSALAPGASVNTAAQGLWAGLFHDLGTASDPSRPPLLLISLVFRCALILHIVFAPLLAVTYSHSRFLHRTAMVVAIALAIPFVLMLPGLFNGFPASIGADFICLSCAIILHAIGLCLIRPASSPVRA